MEDLLHPKHQHILNINKSLSQHKRLLLFGSICHVTKQSKQCCELPSTSSGKSHWWCVLDTVVGAITLPPAATARKCCLAVGFLSWELWQRLSLTLEAATGLANCSNHSFGNPTMFSRMARTLDLAWKARPSPQKLQLMKSVFRQHHSGRARLVNSYWIQP